MVGEEARAQAPCIRVVKVVAIGLLRGPVCVQNCPVYSYNTDSLSQLLDVSISYFGKVNQGGSFG